MSFILLKEERRPFYYGHYNFNCFIVKNIFFFPFFYSCIIIQTMWQTTEKKNIFLEWIYWHYYVVLANIISDLKNIFLFNIYFFSIPILLKTFFSPWKKYKLSYGRGFDFNKILEALSFNLFSRIIGMTARLFLIIIGLISQMIVIIIGFFIIFIWIAIPFLILLGLIFSINGLF